MSKHSDVTVSSRAPKPRTVLYRSQTFFSKRGSPVSSMQVTFGALGPGGRGGCASCSSLVERGAGKGGGGGGKLANVHVFSPEVTKTSSSVLSQSDPQLTDVGKTPDLNDKTDGNSCC
ncbi:hypothetical protein ElyMa_002730900 [Elysia marginata]|uniref:Uncharacterized protein n=1 Tax=Elysia marginata TaxID=1093978 RepID=A0AAV4HFY6_9GAST|nr:hypothetical protein ElyMa_002730900 [Elysia marginata]